MDREDAIAALRRAWEDKGNHPEYHDESVYRLEREWPTLHRAIVALLKTSDA